MACLKFFWYSGLWGTARVANDDLLVSFSRESSSKSESDPAGLLNFVVLDVLRLIKTLFYVIWLDVGYRFTTGEQRVFL